MGIGDRSAIREFAETTQYFPGARPVAGAVGRLIAANPLAGQGPEATGIAAMEAAHKRRRRRRPEAPVELSEFDISSVGRPPDHAPPGGIPAAIADTGGGIVASERRMAPRRAAAGLVDPASEPAPAPDLGDPVTEVQKPANDPEKVRIEGMLPSGAPSGVSAEVQRREGGSGEAWLEEQAGRQQGRQVFGFDRSMRERPEGIAAAAEITEEAPWREKPGMVAIQGTADERDVGVSGIPQGISRAPSPPGMQARELRKFQDAETARYADYDIARAQQEAGLAKQQTLTADPFAGLGAETEARKELIGAEAEAQKGLFGAEAEAEYDIEKQRGADYGVGADVIQTDHAKQMAVLDTDFAEGNLTKEQYEGEVANLEQQTMAAMEVLQGRIYGPQGMRYGGYGGYGYGAGGF